MYDMSQLTKSLKSRIEELTASIETQTTELAAFRRVLEIELAKETAPTAKTPSETPAHSKPATTNGAPSHDLGAIEFTGNKTAFVIAIVRAHGAAGAAPKEIRDVFTARKIPLSENLIYTTLSALAKDKKLQRRDGRYYASGAASVAQKNGGASPTKRHISPAGLKAIREAVKKRWAAKRMADRAAAK
jgi:hypothetical protein